MARQTAITCDRCQQPIICTDDRILDFLQKTYPGKDICPDCDGQIQLTSELAKQDVVNNVPPGTTLKEWLALYENDRP